MSIVEFTTEAGAAIGAGLVMGALQGATPLPWWACALVGIPVGAVGGWAVTLGAWMAVATVWYFLYGRHHKKPWTTDGRNAEPGATAVRSRD